MDLEKAIEEAIEVLKNREYGCKDAVTGAWDVFLCDYFANNSTIVTQSTPIRLTCKCACTDKNCVIVLILSFLLARLTGTNLRKILAHIYDIIDILCCIAIIDNRYLV